MYNLSCMIATCPCSKWEFSTGEEQSQGEMKFIDLFQISGPSQAIEQWTQTSRSTKVIECPTKCQWPWNPTVNINLLILVTMVTGINFLGLFLEVYAEYSGFEEKNMYIGIWGFCFQKALNPMAATCKIGLCTS